MAKFAVRFLGGGNERLELGTVVASLGQGGIECLARLAKRNDTCQQVDGKKVFYPRWKLSPHARDVTRPLGQDQRLGEPTTGGVGAVAGGGTGRI